MFTIFNKRILRLKNDKNLSFYNFNFNLKSFLNSEIGYDVYLITVLHEKFKVHKFDVNKSSFQTMVEIIK